MLQLDNRRLTTSSTPGRRQRSILKAERSYCERLGDKWAKDITGWVRMDSQNIREPLDQLQELKLFNFGQLLPDVQEDESTSSEDRADELLEPLSAAQDVMDRVETYADVRLDRAGQIELWRHLKSTGAAILDFVTHPDGRLQQGHGNLERGWGTLCFAIRAGDQFLEARPFHLRVPDAWIRLMVDGDPSDVSSGAPYCGFKSDLVPWSFASDGPLPESIVSLGAELFPPEMLEALNGIRRLYVCPHRHLFQIPIHALPVRGKPLYEQFDVSYAMKTVHVVDLLRHRTGQNAATRLWLIDTKDDSVSSELLLRRFNASNSWANAGLSAEGLLRDGAVAHQTVMCCHGQMDEARGGRARLRLWGGGRLVADDIHRVSHVSARQNGYQPVDFSTSDWVIAACDAGASRIAMETAPGISLSLVSCGARNVTSSMFRVTPSTAHRFVRYYLEARDEDRPAAFSTACRRVGSRTRQSWAQACLRSRRLVHANVTVVTRVMRNSALDFCA